MSEDELEHPLVHWEGSHPTTSSIKFKVRTQHRDINPRLFSPVLYARGMIRELISYRHELQHRLASLPHPEERVLHIYDQARLLWHMQRTGINLHNYSGLFAIFSHCRQVKEVYLDHGRRLPNWFLQKFGRYL